MDEASKDAISNLDNGGSVIDGEVEALKSIFIHELDVCNENGFPRTLILNLEPATADRKEECFVCLTLSITIAKEYPECLPKVLIKNSRGLSDEGLNRILKDINSKADVLKGNPMLFELIDIAKEYLTFWNMPSCECAICLYEFRQDDVFTKTECYHYFHFYCLSKYVKYSKEQFEEQQPKGGGIIAKAFQAECPVCRVAIPQFVGESEDLYPAPSAASAEDESYEISDEMKEVQEKLSFLYENQKAKGGIIDLEEEKNKFLIEISSVPSVSLPNTSVSQEVPAKTNPKTQPKNVSRQKDSHYLKNKAFAKKTASRNNSQSAPVILENGHEENVNKSEMVSDDKSEQVSDKKTENISDDKTEIVSEDQTEEVSKNKTENDNHDSESVSVHGKQHKHVPNDRFHNRSYRGNYYREEKRGWYGNYRQDNRRYYNGYNYRDNYYNDHKQTFRSREGFRRENLSKHRNSHSETENSIDGSHMSSRNRRDSHGSNADQTRSNTSKNVMENGKESSSVENPNEERKRPIPKSKFRRDSNGSHKVDSKSEGAVRAAPSRRDRYSSRCGTDNEEVASVALVNNSPKSDSTTTNQANTSGDKYHIKHPSKGHPRKFNSGHEEPLIDKLNKDYEGIIRSHKEEYSYCDECGSSNRVQKDGVNSVSKESRHSNSCSKSKRIQLATNPRNNSRGRHQFNRPFGGFHRPHFDNRERRGTYSKEVAQNSKTVPTDFEEGSKLDPKSDNSPKVLHTAAKFHPPGIPVTKPSISTLSTENL